MDSTRGPTRMTIEQTFKHQDQESERNGHEHFGLDVWDDGEEDWQEEEDRIVDKLMDDMLVRVTTTSGAQHTISMNKFAVVIKMPGEEHEKVWDIIFDNWIERVNR